MTMKTPKATPQNAAPEECGVWLDTVQLKEKNKRKRPARPISKQLNPLAEGEGYSLAVALNFTQTKMEMPKTKQSSISNFFTSHRRVLNKMSSSEVPSLPPLQPLLSSTSSAITTMVSMRKRRRDICLKKSDLYDTESGVGNWQSGKNVTEMDATLWQKKAEHYSPSLNLYCESEEDLSEECKPPQSKRRLTENSLLPNNKQPPPQAWSQDPLFTCSQNSETEFYLPDQKSSTSKNYNSYEPGFLDSLQSEETFENLIDATRRTSTQKLIKNPSSSQLDDDKENSRSLSFSSMSKRSSSSNLESLSDHKWTEPKGTSPQKHASQLWNKTEKDECFETKWTKRISSPFKKPLKQIREVDGESLATLFTQDSEGFRVIAHRGLQTRSPLKDQSNLSTEIVRTNVYTRVAEDEDEDEMLFTQDSQGNMVIKH